MTHAITMPALSDTMSNGRLVKWTKKPGERIKKGDVIAEVETDKAVMDVEAFQDGYLMGPLAAEGCEAPVGHVIGYIADEAQEVAPATPPLPPPPPVPETPKPAPQAPPTALDGAALSPVLAAAMHSGFAGPLRRRNDAAAPVPGSDGASLKITESAARSAIEAGPPYRIERASMQREAVARQMIACASTPTFRVTAQLPLGALTKVAQQRDLSLALLLARACALTVTAHPLFNAAYTADGLARRERVDIGIAVDSGDGLVTPVLRGAAGRSLAALGADWTSLREKAQARRLSPADYNGATFYLSDLGVFPVVLTFDSIVPLGASAILSVGASYQAGTFFTLACDHRVVFGADAARFLETFHGLLTEPSKVLS